MPYDGRERGPAGTYTGPGNVNVAFNSRPITVRGIGGAAVTFFDTQGVGPAFSFVGTETATSILKGVSLKLFCSHRSMELLLGSDASESRRSERLELAAHDPRSCGRVRR